MIERFVKAWEARKGEVEAKFRAGHPEGYIDVVRAVVEILRGEYDFDSPDPERIHQIDDGDYQGTLVFVIAAGGYQPSDYWFVKIGYGSCSGCDTLQRIREYSEEPPTDNQVADYMALALHIVQNIKPCQEEPWAWPNPTSK